MTFTDLGVPAALTQVLARDGKFTAYPIQQQTLPDSLDGRDVLGRGKTGSGKTIAFCIPLVARLARSGSPRLRSTPRGMILAPTRELATQINQTLEPLAQAMGLRTTTIFGGVSQKRQVDALQSGVDVIVACPGRLEDLLKQGLLTLDKVEVAVLDEADHMADLGFLPGVNRLLAATQAEGQRLFFSATLDRGVDTLVKRYLRNEILHSVDEPVHSVPDMTHHVFEVSADEKKTVVKTLASGTGRRILFTRTKHHAKKLAKQLTAQGIPAADLHGNLSQNARDRNLTAFGEGDVRVLVATDIAARGVHVDSVELVVHVDPPAEHKAYLHRSGRTARAGNTGDVVTLMLPEQRSDVQPLLRKASITATPVAVGADSAEVLNLVGDQAEYVKPAPAPQQQRSHGGGSPRRGGGSRNGGSRSGSSGGGPRGGSRGGGPSRGGTSGGGSARGGSGRNGSAGRGGSGRPQRSHRARTAG